MKAEEVVKAIEQGDIYTYPTIDNVMRSLAAEIVALKKRVEYLEKNVAYDSEP